MQAKVAQESSIGAVLDELLDWLLQSGITNTVNSERLQRINSQREVIIELE